MSHYNITIAANEQSKNPVHIKDGKYDSSSEERTYQKLAQNLTISMSYLTALFADLAKDCNKMAICQENNGLTMELKNFSAMKDSLDLKNKYAEENKTSQYWSSVGQAVGGVFGIVQSFFLQNTGAGLDTVSTGTFSAVAAHYMAKAETQKNEGEYISTQASTIFNVGKVYSAMDAALQNLNSVLSQLSNTIDKQQDFNAQNM